MPRNFYILRDDRGLWAISDGPFVTDDGISFQSISEAKDQLRTILSQKGLVMGKSFAEGAGLRVEALEPGASTDGPRSMLYSARALETIEAIREKVGLVLKQRALDLAARSGRKLISDDDVWAAFDGMLLSDLYPDSDEGAGDER